MNRHTESQLALLVGGDLDGAERTELDRRSAVCPRTRACRDELQAGLDALHECRDHPPVDVAEEESLWPAMSTRLPDRPARGPLEAFRPWVPAITIAALLLALATVATNPRIERGPEPVARSADWPAVSQPVRVVSPRGSIPRPARARPVPVDVVGSSPFYERSVESFPPSTAAGADSPRFEELRVVELPGGDLLFVVPEPRGVD